jgi:hypothetical protein
MNSHILHIDIRGYWHPGGGRGQGMVLDATCHRDAHGLPVLPGRHLKGLLRDALERAEAWRWKDFRGLANQLFGDRTEVLEGSVPNPGSLRVGDARLPDAIANHLASENGRELVPGLFRALHATAVEHDSGVAKDKSLRGIEVLVPLKIKAAIGLIPGQKPPPDDWPEKLRGVLPLIDAVGAHRSRGIGRAILSLEGAP